MKRIRPGKLMMMAMVLALAPPVMAAPLPNAGFESGNFGEWTLEIPRGRPKNQHGKRPAGTANVVSSWGSQVGLTTRYAVAGDHFAVLGTLADGNFRGNKTFDITLSRRLALDAGDAVSGWAFFFNGDCTPQDCAWVNIYNHEGDLVATPWLECSGGVIWHDGNSTPWQTATPWTQWEWEAGEDGCYTVSFGMTTSDDNCDASYGAFDELLISAGPTTVPEPASAVLLLLGMGGLLTFRRRAGRI